MASAAMASDAADMRLLASFTVWPRPGWSPTANTLPSSSSNGRTCAIAAAGLLLTTATCATQSPQAGRNGAPAVALDNALSAAVTRKDVPGVVARRREGRERL
jgi:hypothetical protein